MFIFIQIEPILSILVGFYKNRGDLWRVSDCEELVGVTHRRWWGWFSIL